MSNGKVFDNFFNSWIDKKDLIHMGQYFPKTNENFGGNINVRFDISNYATKSDWNNATWIDTSKLTAKSNLASLKAKVDKLDVDKLMSVPIDLSKLSDVVKNDIVKKSVYPKLAAKVNNNDASGSVVKTKYNTGKKFPDTSELF